MEPESLIIAGIAVIALLAALWAVWACSNLTKATDTLLDAVQQLIDLETKRQRRILNDDK